MFDKLRLHTKDFEIKEKDYFILRHGDEDCKTGEVKGDVILFRCNGENVIWWR